MRTEVVVRVESCCTTSYGGEMIANEHDKGRSSVLRLCSPFRKGLEMAKMVMLGSRLVRRRFGRIEANVEIDGGVWLDAENAPTSGWEGEEDVLYDGDEWYDEYLDGLDNGAEICGPWE